MRVLFISNLFPNALEPTKGMFNAQQVRTLAKYCTITKVIAPTGKTMPDEIRDGLTVMHPRFQNIPVLSRPFNGWLFARSIASHLQPSDIDFRRFPFDIALVNWAYPDAYGVMLLAKKSRFPYATTVQGSDVNVLFRNPHRKRQVLGALRGSAVVFCRSEALRSLLATEGVTATTIYNGVDREKFHPMDRAECCRQLGLSPDRRRILFVGNLQPVKGPTVLAEAFALLTRRSDLQSQPVADVDLIFIGSGPEQTKAAKLLSLHSNVLWSSPKPHSEIPLWMNACDVLCLPSFNEGLPNVCIEAAACGLPVVASNVGGVPEVIHDGINGFLVPPGSPSALADALQRALSRTWEKNVLVDSVKQFDWDANARQVVTVLQSAVQSSES